MLFILDADKQVLWKTAKTLMKCCIMRHFSGYALFATLKLIFKCSNILRGVFIIYCNCHRNSHAMHEIPMKSNTGNSSIFYLSMDTSIVSICALVFVRHALEIMSFI